MTNNVCVVYNASEIVLNASFLFSNKQTFRQKVRRDSYGDSYGIAEISHVSLSREKTRHKSQISGIAKLDPSSLQRHKTKQLHRIDT